MFKFDLRISTFHVNNEETGKSSLSRTFTLNSLYGYSFFYSILFKTKKVMVSLWNPAGPDFDIGKQISDYLLRR